MSDCVSLPAFLSSRVCSLGQEWAKSWILVFSAPLAAVRKQLLPSPHARTKLVSTERLQAGVLKAGPAGPASLMQKEG